MLKRILEAVGVDPETCARLLGISPALFGEWMSGQQPIPTSLQPMLAAVLGVPAELLRPVPRQLRASAADITPAIWYKFRGPQANEADRENVLLIRELGYFMHELETVTQKRSIGWSSLFEAVRRSTDSQAPPRQQGRLAARSFRELTGLDQGASGIGEVFRGNLRNQGVLVIESPIQHSQLDGCAFFVGTTGAERPCVFANSYKSTWFHRNMTLMHELAHAIFDAESAGAAIDFKDAETADLIEQRANSFAQEVLLPREVLRHVAQRAGVRWDAITGEDVARLVANAQVEQAVVATAAADAGFASEEIAEAVREMDIARVLPAFTERALSTREFVRQKGAVTKEWLAKRTTTIPSRRLRLPVHYVDAVVRTFSSGCISKGKAARMLMIAEEDLESRFPHALELALAE